MSLRGFEVVKEYEALGIALPKRKTAHSAGYDFAAAATVLALPGKVTLIPTGICLSS